MKIIKRKQATTNKSWLCHPARRGALGVCGPSLCDNTGEEALESLAAITLIAKSENSKIENEELEQNWLKIHLNKKKKTPRIECQSYATFSDSLW